MNYRECFLQGKQRLAEAGILEADLDARLLLEHICLTNRNDLLAHGERPVEEEKIKEYHSLIDQRVKRIPLQYLTGEQEFMGLTFKVNESVLIPRQDTEILVEEIMKTAHDGSDILDMCTGSGCILISLLKYANNSSGVGVDISNGALEVAKYNAKTLLEDEKEWSFIESDLFEQVKGTFDIIVSNPPYIRSEMIEELQPEVRTYEPFQALDGKEDGLYFYKKIASECKAHLKIGGSLYFEIGYDQGIDVKEIMEKEGFFQVNIKKDLAGLDRVVYGIFESL